MTQVMITADGCFACKAQIRVETAFQVTGIKFSCPLESKWERVCCELEVSSDKVQVNFGAGELGFDILPEEVHDFI